MTFLPVSAGRLLLRHFASGQAALVGCIQVPPSVVLREDACYLLMMADDRVDIAPVALEEALPADCEGQGIEAALLAPIWPVTMKGAVCVRTVAAFPESGIWTVYGAAANGLPRLGHDPSGHDWIDINAGLVVRIPAPVDACGSHMSAMLSGHPVWPDAAGVLHTLPVHSSGWRGEYHRMSSLMALCGAGELAESDLHRQLREDGRLSMIRHLGPVESEYLRFLAALQRAGHLVPEAPRDAENHRRHMEAVRRCVGEALASAETVC